MKFNVRTSIFELTLAGFLVTVLPLIGVLLHTIVRVDALSQRIGDTLLKTNQAVQSSRVLVSHALSLERCAGQFRVLRDPKLLRRYVEQRARLHRITEGILALEPSQTTIDHLDRLVEREQQLYEFLLADTPAEPALGDDLERLPALAELVRSIPLEVSDTISVQAEKLSLQADQVQRLLLVQAVALIPLALSVAVAFSFLVAKPLRHLGNAIRLLGAGDFSQPLEIRGPADVRALGKRIEWLRSRLREVEQQKVMFIRHVSHELKTPLTAIREGIELLSDEIVGRLSEGQAEVTAIILANSKQLQKQIEDLLKFNTALIEDATTERQSVHLQELVRHSIGKHKLTRLSRNLAIEAQLVDVIIQGDRDQLGTIADNLISNAVNHSPKGGTIEIRLRSDDDRVILEVRDEGPGIPESERERVFEPYYRGENASQSPIQGTGLGLAISQRYANLHFGQITILDSARGAHFQVNLPVRLDSR